MHPRLHESAHPLVKHKIDRLRRRETDPKTFRELIRELSILLAYEATREVHVESVDIVTPVTATTGVKLADPRPLVVPILRAGLGMLDGMTRLLPTAEVGFLGMQRDEETLDAITYANRLPDDLSGRQCFLLDPMLATGGTLVAAINPLRVVMRYTAPDARTIWIDEQALVVAQPNRPIEEIGIATMNTATIRPR